MATVRSWLAAVSLALGLVWVPVRFVITEVDSPRTALFGAPLPWRSPSIVSSMQTDIYLGPLLIDAAFWLLVAFGLVHLWKHHAPMNRIVNICAGLAVAVIGLAGALSTAAMVSFGTTADAWYGPFAMTYVSLQLF